MRRPLKCFSIAFLISVVLFNVHIFFQFHHEQEVWEREKPDQQTQTLHEKQAYDFLVLDWTAQQHIFKEQDLIQCDFSHITPEYCQARFNSVLNSSHRLHLIARCSRLPALHIRWTSDRTRLQRADLLAYHSIHMPSGNLPELIRNDRKQQFSTVYVLESEVHSANGQHWHRIDFPMWYNLQRSYPAPATYFDLKVYLNELFAPVRASFAGKKQTAPIVWMISNCAAHNGRQAFVKQLMSHIRIDSYGNCLNTIQGGPASKEHQSNALLYASYKFVIAIENSNCEDYVTEKLIDALASASIPIVASRDGKPDYRRFAPKHSYINVYDYPSAKELAAYLNYLSNNETAYNEYLWFRQLPANKYASAGAVDRSLTENLRLTEEILGANATMRQWLLTRETSVNKYCKLAQFIHTNEWQAIDRRKKFDRPTAEEVCLPRNDLASHLH